MSPINGRALARAGAVVVLGFVLMFAGHFLAFVGWTATEGMRYRPVYWWGYLVVYPLAGAILARLDIVRGWRAAGLLCLAPALYFLNLGIRHDSWGASDAGLAGSLLAAGLTGIVASRVRPVPSSSS